MTLVGRCTCLVLCVAFAPSAPARQAVSLDLTPIWSPQPTAPSAFGWAIDVADGDGDGILDLAVSAPDVSLGTGEVWVLRGPDFLTGIKAARPSVVGVHDVYGCDLSFQDLDLDGVADLLIHDRDMTGTTLGRLWVVRGPLFGSAVRVPKGVGHESWYQATSWDVGDVNQDGWPDLVTGSSLPLLTGGGGLEVYPGPFGFSQLPALSLEPAGPTVWMHWGWSLLIADVTGDSLNDIVTSEQTPGPAHAMVALENLNVAQTYLFPFEMTHVEGGVKDGPIHYQDVNGDGYGDVVAGATPPYDWQLGASINKDPSIMIWWGPTHSTNTLLQQKTIPTSNSLFASALDLGDVNRDGHVDLVAGAPNMDLYNGKDGRVTIFFGPSFTQTQEIDAAGPDVRLGNDVVVRDLDGNGFAELFVASEGAAVVLLYRHPTLRALGPTDVSVALGGQVALSTECGRLSAHRPFLLLTSISGTTPGLDVPYGNGVVHVPLNVDAVTTLGIAYANGPLFQNFLGSLDNAGTAVSMFSLPPGLAGPSLVGLGLQLAAITADPSGAIDYATDAVEITLVP